MPRFWPSAVSIGACTSSNTRTRSWPRAPRRRSDSMTMRGCLAFVLSLAAAAASAENAATPTPTAAKTSRVLLAHVVSIDFATAMLTYRMTTGEEKTAMVDATALPRARELKPGDGVMLTLHDEAG